jgi:TM2 domain-containing membrane protein YozV
MGNNPYPQPGAPFGVDAYGRPLSDKSKMTAGLLQLFLGSFGVGRFYLGYTGIGIAQIAVSWLTCGIGAIWPLIDAIMMLTDKVPDSVGRTLRE